MADSPTKPLLRAASSDSDMMNPSKDVDTQDACPLFDLAVELRNEIYSLVFAVETKEEDGSIELDKSTAPPSKALTMTCQVIRSGTRAIYKAAYQNYPKHTFTITVHDRESRYGPFIPKLSNDLFAHMRSIRVHWRANNHNKGNPLRFTSHFDSPGLDYGWTTRVELHDEFWRGRDRTSGLVQWYEYLGREAMDRFRAARVLQSGELLCDSLAIAVSNTVQAGPERELQWWWGDMISPIRALPILGVVMF
jgi:hypothetical protein